MRSLLFFTCDSDEDCEAEADQEHHKNQDEMSFRQSVEPHGGQPVTRRKTLALTQIKNLSFFSSIVVNKADVERKHTAS